MRATAWIGALVLLVAGFAVAGASSREQQLVTSIQNRRAAMVETLERWVEHNTGTFNRAGLESFARLLASELREIGFEVTLEAGRALEVPGLEGAVTGPTLLARREAPSGGSGPRLLLAGHYDTVFELDSRFQRIRFDLEADHASGPGVADMKGGLVVLIETLRALEREGDLDRASWTVLLNGDEEIGSLGSRPLIEREARRAEAGFVFEAARRGGAMVRSRRGLGQFRIEVRGVAAHSGSSHEKGRSAVRALATKILRIEELTDYERGLTLNVGTVRGGTKRNIVPDRAEAWIDLRFDDAATGEVARRELERIAHHKELEGTEAVFWGTLHRPPKPATPEVDALLSAHAAVASDLGLSLPKPVHAGGGTDGSLMAGVGLPTLDSMGVVGGGAHTKDEFVELGSLSERAALAAVLLQRIVRDRVRLPTPVAAR